MPLRRSELLARCEEVIKGYNPKLTTLDAYALDQLGDTDGPEPDPDAVFVKQVFYGCVRNKKALKVFLNNFYADNSGTTLRADLTTYMVLAYLALFRLEELTYPVYAQFLSSMDPAKMHIFLSYLFDRERLRGQLLPEWVGIFDLEFVEESIIGALERHIPAVKQLCAQMFTKAFGLAAAQREMADQGLIGVKIVEAKAATVPESPNINPPKPRRVPEPMRIEQQSVAKPVPGFIHRRTLRDIEEERAQQREKTREAVAAKYSPADEFKFHVTRSNLAAVTAEVEAERSREMQPEGFRAQPPPAPPEDVPPVRLNVATVLREDALYKKKQEKEARLIKEYESQLRDSTAFYRWQTQMREQDEAIKRREVERRRVEMAQAQEAAIEASDRQRRFNAALGRKMKEESVAMQAQVREEQDLEMLINRRLAEEIREVRDTAPQQAKAKVFAEKQARREALAQELAEARHQRELQLEAEQEEREDRIRQIRALERVHQDKSVPFDPTESSGLGLLEEMSLVELRERLAMNRARDKELEEERRQDIVNAKMEREQALRARVSNIARIREAASVANREARARRKQKEEADKVAAQRLRDAGNLELAERLVEKRGRRRAEAEHLAEEERRVANQRLFLGAAKSQIEEKHFEELLQGAEREVRLRQERAKAAAREYEKVQQTSLDVRSKHIRKEAKARRKFLHDKDVELAHARTEAQAKMFSHQEKKKTMVRTAVAHKAVARDKLIERNLYAHTASQRSVERARRLQSAGAGVVSGGATAGAPAGATGGATAAAAAK